MMPSTPKDIALLVFGTLFCLAAIPMDNSKGQQIRPPNYDESLVPKFELPSVLQSPIPLDIPSVGNDRPRIKTPAQWPAHRQALVAMLAEQEYGFLPTETVKVTSECFDDADAVLSGKTHSNIRRRQLAITLERNGESLRIDMIVW